MGLLRFIAGLFSRSARLRSRSRKPGEAEHQWLGREGERIAAEHLRRAGCKILYRNFRPKGGGEIDIVCREIASGMLLFIEVKTRGPDPLTRPAAAVTVEKQHLIQRGARAWLRMLDRTDVRFRFDIAEVLIEEGEGRVNIIRAAFTLPDDVYL